MPYAVKEIYLTLQGEGMQAGRRAVFLRFAGCNLWSGLEKDRPKAICQFCDTDFVGTDGPLGGRYGDAESLCNAVSTAWQRKELRGLAPLDTNRVGAFQRDETTQPLVVCTGGEPTLQLDEALICALQKAGFEVAIETNGTRPLPAGLDWVCVSPKAHTELVVRSGDELKLVYPQPELLPDSLGALNFRYYLLQPMDGPERQRNTELAREYCMEHPPWALSIQWHKELGLA